MEGVHYICDICKKTEPWKNPPWWAIELMMKRGYDGWEMEFHICSPECERKLMNMTRKERVKLANDILRNGRRERHPVESAPPGSGADLREVRSPVDSSLAVDGPAQRPRVRTLQHCGVCHYNWSTIT